jgi:hypothetical protein
MTGNRFAVSAAVVVLLIWSPIVEAQYLQTAEVTPAVVEEAKSIIAYAVDRGSQVELLAQRIELNSEVNRR